MDIYNDVQDISLPIAAEVNILISGGNAAARTALACLIHQYHDPAGSFIVFSGRHETPAAAQAMIRASNGGTLFIEELVDLDHNTQRELLRVLNARRAGVEPTAPRRVITAMGDYLQGRIASDQVLGDLFYRLNSIHLVVEPCVPQARTWLM